MTTVSYPVPGLEGEHYWVFETDAHGNEIPEVKFGEPEFVSPKILDEARNTEHPITDVLIVIHGWQTDQKSNDAMWIFDTIIGGVLGKSDKACTHDYKSYVEARPNTKFLSVGVHWPSAVGAGVVDEKVLDSESLEDSVERMRRITKALQKTDPIASSQIEEIVGAGLAAEDEEDANDEESAADAYTEAFRRTLCAGKKVIRAPDSGHLEEDGDDDEEVKGAVSGFQEVSGLRKMTRNVLRKVLRRTEHMLFGQFELRSRAVGTNGVHSLLALLQEAAPLSTRFHILSHSLGAPAHCAGLIGEDTGCLLRKKLHSSVFLQAAIASDCFEEGGRYREMASGLRPVAGASVVTTCQADKALAAYQVFYGNSLGMQGAVNSEPLSTHVIDMGNEQASYELVPDTLYNVVADEFIDDHNNAFNEAVMNLIWKAFMIDIPQDAYRLNTDLSKEYFQERGAIEQVEEGAGCRIV